jgi:assimilatory nitrate reductase electron transfer subunit
VDRAIVVDERMTSVTDPRIHAIGECAQFDGQVYGLVAPAWDQAGVLADVLTGGDATYRGSQLVTRLKAADVDLAAMGEADVDHVAGVDDEGLEVLRFADPTRGLYQKIVIRDGRVTGAIMLGGAETVGTVTQLFDRSGLVPADRRALIFPGVADAAAVVDPAALPDDAQVCRCNSVSAGETRRACGYGAGTVAEVAMCTRATTGCGGCRDDVAGIIAAASPAAADPAGATDPAGEQEARAELVEVAV